MQENHRTKYKHLTESERYLIEKWKKEGFSNRKIAKLLGKAPQTIHNEIKRGQVDLSFTGKGIEYSAQKAHADYLHFRTAVGRTDTWTPEKADIIREKITLKYSPAVISLLDGMPSVVTIYQWIDKHWIPGISKKDLLYPRKTKKETSQPKKEPRKKHALSIEQRPESIHQREEVGHFEIDLIVLSRNKGKQILSLVDRKTRLTILRLIPDKTAQSVNSTIKELSKIYHIKSITADNGSEFMKLDEAMDCPIYYAHPYASYERGSNENVNRFVRRFIKKGQTKATPLEVAFIEKWINDYPRKLFGYLSTSQLPEVANLLL